MYVYSLRVDDFHLQRVATSWGGGGRWGFFLLELVDHFHQKNHIALEPKQQSTATINHILAMVLNISINVLVFRRQCVRITYFTNNYSMLTYMPFPPEFYCKIPSLCDTLQKTTSNSLPQDFYWNSLLPSHNTKTNVKTKTAEVHFSLFLWQLSQTEPSQSRKWNRGLSQMERSVWKLSL